MSWHAKLRELLGWQPVRDPAVGQLWVSEHSGNVMRVARVERTDCGGLVIDVERQCADPRPRRGLRWGMATHYASSLSAWRRRIREEKRRLISPPFQSPPSPAPAAWPFRAPIASGELAAILIESHDTLNAARAAQGEVWDDELLDRVRAVQARMKAALGLGAGAAAAAEAAS